MFSRCDYVNYKLETKNSKYKIVSAIFKGGQKYSIRMLGLPCIVVIPELVAPSSCLYLLDSYMGLIKKSTGAQDLTNTTLLDWDKLIQNSEQTEVRKIVTDILMKQGRSITLCLPFLSNNDGLIADCYISTIDVTSIYLLFNRPPLLTDPSGKTIFSENLEHELEAYFYFGNTKKSLNHTISNFLEKNRFLTVQLPIDNNEAGKKLISTIASFVNECIKSFGHSCVHKTLCVSTVTPFIIDAALVSIYSILDVIAVFNHKRTSNGFVLEIILSSNKFREAVFENPSASVLFRFIFSESAEGISEVDGEPLIYSSASISDCISLLVTTINKCTKVQMTTDESTNHVKAVKIKTVKREE